MASVLQYKEYIWAKYKSGDWSVYDVLSLKPKSSNTNWNKAVSDANRWAKKEIGSMRSSTIGRLKPINISANKTLRKSNPQKDPEIIKAILNTDARVKKDSRPKGSKSSRPPTFMGKRLH